MRFGFVKSSGCRSCSESSRLQIQCTTDGKTDCNSRWKGDSDYCFSGIELDRIFLWRFVCASLLLEQAELALMQIVNNTRQLDIISIVGMPVVVNSTLMNCAWFFRKVRFWVLCLRLICLIIKNSTRNAGLLLPWLIRIP